MGERSMDTLLKLKKQRMTRRIAEGAVAGISLAFLIIFCVLRENSKVITSVAVTPFLSYDHIEYTKGYIAAILISGLIFGVSLSFLIGDLLACKIHHTEIDGDDIIVYNGPGLTKLLVNGEEKDSMLLKSYMETKLTGGVTLTVTSRFFMSYHIIFSDGRPAIDL